MYQLGATRDTLDRLEGRLQSVRPPFGGKAGSFEISYVREEAEASGIRSGDRLVEVSGVPVTGRGAIPRALARANPGDTLDVVVSRSPDGAGGEGPLVHASITLAARADQPEGAMAWVPALIISVAMPWLCLLLGAWVALVRPMDGRAWLLFGMMLTFGQAPSSQPSHLTGAAGVLAVGWQACSQVLWPAAMLLFAIYFPERLPFDRRLPWAKWILVGPLVAFSLTSAFVTAISQDRLAPVASMEVALSGMISIVMALAMTCIGLFFAAMGYKSGTLASPDARRRARVLVIGAQVALTPSMLLVVPALIRGVSPGNIAPAWITAIIFSCLFLFPATLAYVVVVQRALDVRVVVRQGMQYTLARGGVKVLRWVIMVGVVVGVILLAKRPQTRNVDTVRLLGIGGILLAVTGRGTERLAGWIDRRFFRESYDAERILGELADQVMSLVDTGEILEMVARRLSTSLHVSKVACLVAGPDGYRVMRTIGFPDEDAVAGAGATLPIGSHTVARLREAGGPLRTYLDDPASWVNREGGPDESERALLRSLGTQLLIPLTVKDRLPGIISLSAKRSEEAYSATDLRVLRTVASQSGLALENSRLAAAVAAETAHRERLNREVEIAREVQERLFPQRLPAVPGLDYAGACRPALGVGGDYYDFLPLPEGRLGIAIADVSGKGIAAALMMASLQASLRGQSMQGDGAVAGVVAIVNRLVVEASPDNRYATFFYAHFDPARLTLTYVNAGHCPPMLLRHGRGREGIERLNPGGTVVGLFADATFVERTVTLRPGDRIVAYTDGISEAFNASDEEFGEDRLAEASLATGGLSAAETIGALMQRTDAFVDGAPQSDDMTIVVMHLAL